MFQKVAVIFNPNKSRAALDRYIARVGELSDGQVQLQVFETESHDDVTIKARQAVSLGCELLVAAGGDGTLRGVLEAAVEAHRPLCPLPLGVSNDYAHALGIHDVESAARAVIDGELRSVDLGWCAFEDEAGQTRQLHFCSTAGIGLLADRTRNQLRSVRRLKPLFRNAISPLLTLLVTAKGRRVPTEIRINDQVFDRDLKLFEISNVSEAGGVAYTPYAQLDNGHLDAWMISNRGIFGTASILASALSGKHLGRAGLDYFSDAADFPNDQGITRPASISLAPSEPMAVHLNGDHVGFTPAHFGIVPRRLRVLAAKSEFSAGTGTPVRGMSDRDWYRPVGAEASSGFYSQ